MIGIHVDSPLPTEITLDLHTVFVGEESSENQHFAHLGDGMFRSIVSTEGNLSGNRMIVVLSVAVLSSRCSVHPYPGAGIGCKIRSVPSPVVIQVRGIWRLHGRKKVKDRIRLRGSLVNPLVKVKTAISIMTVTENPISSLRGNDPLLVGRIIRCVTGNGKGGVSTFAKRVLKIV